MHYPQSASSNTCWPYTHNCKLLGMSWQNSSSFWLKKSSGPWRRSTMLALGLVPCLWLWMCYRSQVPNDVTRISGDIAQNLTVSKKIYNKMTLKSRRTLTAWGQKMAKLAAKLDSKDPACTWRPLNPNISVLRPGCCPRHAEEDEGGRREMRHLGQDGR